MSKSQNNSISQETVKCHTSTIAHNTPTTVSSNEDKKPNNKSNKKKSSTTYE